MKSEIQNYAYFIEIVLYTEVDLGAGEVLLSMIYVERGYENQLYLYMNYQCLL
jgi:hypothetical protein